MTVFNDVGYTWCRKALSERDISQLETSISWNSTSGTRDITLSPILQTKLTHLANPILPDAHIVRLTAFNKTQENNWSLPWHQDRVIVSQKREDDPRFTNWTRKGDYWHCEPPIRYLENMIFSRIYIDPAGQETGDLELAQSSHKRGKIPHDDIEDTISNSSIIACEGERGDVLFVKALTLHRSGRLKTISSRKALRVDFSNDAKIYEMANI